MARALHVFIVFLVLLALGSQVYVQLHYDYADAPENVKMALIAGAGAMAVLALLLGPRVLARGRGLRLP